MKKSKKIDTPNNATAFFYWTTGLWEKGIELT